MIQIDSPYQISPQGRTASSIYEDHIRELIELVLFTNPGERVNRPDFGSGLMQLIFAPNSSELATATEYMVQGNLQQWLGELIQVNSVQVTSEDSSLRIHVEYTIRRTQQPQTADFSREL